MTNITKSPSIMASHNTIVNRYQLESEFGDNTVTHRTFRSDLGARQRRIEVRTTWISERSLGSGAFGEVWLQRETGSGDLRAVKVIGKAQLKTRELEALIELRDVRTDDHELYWLANAASIRICSSRSWGGLRIPTQFILPWNTSSMAISAGTWISIRQRPRSVPGRLRRRSSRAWLCFISGRFAIVI